LGDITQINGSMVEPVNVIIGGSPCQDLSVAGRRAGLAGERSGLFMEQIRIIKEMRCADAARGRTGTDIRPRWMVWENVPGAFSSNKGEDFGAVLQETIKIAEPQVPAVSVPKNGWPTAGCLTDVGGKWSVAWRVFDAQFWGVPQRRKRIALVADFGGPSAENASHLSQILEASPHPKYSLSAKACLGIVRRAEHRGKELPPLLKAALLNQAGLHSASKETASTEPTPQDATAKDGQRE
jgi:site-specific DNA-cytosine methylase